MLKQAGVANIISEFDEWSKPHMFWEVRKERNVNHYSRILSPVEQLITAGRIVSLYGLKGLKKGFENRKIFYRAILDGKLGYCLFKGIK
ncbi:hypothetical protein MFMK1_000361 [Metallumcola ferriviriculae]|uniref:Uncharacterized protein n=1 Tax=Metallumcola ferriviriculae TaxID=3039180 RepID=A0AAU0UN06_9FIRM|nr:hypothetical protein MFMK1_000361 [Desulfitibacteraceae bacterium MK1]